MMLLEVNPSLFVYPSDAETTKELSIFSFRGEFPYVIPICHCGIFPHSLIPFCARASRISSRIREDPPCSRRYFLREGSSFVETVAVLFSYWSMANVSGKPSLSLLASLGLHLLFTFFTPQWTMMIEVTSLTGIALGEHKETNDIGERPGNHSFPSMKLQ